MSSTLTNWTAPEVRSDYNLSFSVDPFITGWNRTLQRSLDIEVRSLNPSGSCGVRVFSLPIGSQAFRATKSYFFVPPPGEIERQATVAPDRLLNVNAADSPARTETEPSTEETEPETVAIPKTLTRFRIPPDAIKIEDRLQYILQPPLEMILAQPTLEMPFEPFPYQREGVAFLYGAHFAILADEMGLGKTMQAITTVRLLLRSGEIRSVLFVCPKPLVTNWKREFDLWAPEINVQVIEGGPQRRKWVWQLDDVPVRIANYELLNRDREYYDCPRSRGGPMFDLVILDESQRIKNQSSATSEAARAIPRKRNWALTGTPVENSQEDLVGIFEFLSPGFLESGLKPSEISSLVGNHILRRTKDKVLSDLPPKMIRDAALELTPEQYASYKLAEDSGRKRLKEMDESETGVSIRNVFELIIRLKQICNFDPLTGESSKLERLSADLEEVVESGRKAIIFSQWVETLLHLKQELAPFGPIEYHGRIPSKQRDEVIRKFREEKEHHIILMSYGAGSVGLNLQFAGYVFLFDRWWNPAVEDQAINRAHRIGASGPVTVTRFISAGTIEEKIDKLLRHKRELSEEILSGARGLNHSSGMSQEEIFGLFNLKPRHAKKAA